MKARPGAIILSAIVLLGSMPALSWGYAGGSGTAQDPYQIGDANDLVQLGATPDDQGKCFVLVVDIDLSGKNWSTAVIPEFGGTFDGNALCIRHLVVKGESYLGLFGKLTEGAQVKDLGVVDVNIASSQGYVGIGSLVGHSVGGSVTNCYSTGVITGGSEVGGLVGDNGGTLINSYSTCTVKGYSLVGGLVGLNGGCLSNCYGAGAVTGSFAFGGLVGLNFFLSSVNGCFWDTEQSGQISNIGGTGLTTTQMEDIQTYLNAGWDFIGESKNGTSEIWQMPQGGGYPVLGVFNGYCPPQLKGQGIVDDPYMISTAEELGAVWYNPGSNYRLAASIDLSDIRWATPVIPAFSGTFDGNGLSISHLTVVGGGYLGLFGHLKPDAQVKDLGLVDVNVVGSGIFIGGLVGRNSKGDIRDSYSNGTVTSTNWYVGGLVGGNLYGSVSNCFSTGTVKGMYGVGGLTGANNGSVSRCYSNGAAMGNGVGGLVGSNSGYITDSYSSNAVTSPNGASGLVDNNTGSVSRCYSIGLVKGDSYANGLVGDNRGSTSGGFWDTQTSGISGNSRGRDPAWNPGSIGNPDPNGSVGKTTAQMKDIDTYLNAGWDFVGEIQNGTEDIWCIPAGDYPHLLWEGVCQ